MMMKCPECGCKFREQEGKEEEYEEEGGEEEESAEGEPAEDEVQIQKIEVPEDKEEIIKKKLMELGKMLASIK